MNTKKTSNQNRDPNQKDWHEKRIEQGRAEQERAEAAKNRVSLNDGDKPTLGGSQQRVGSPSKDHNQGGGTKTKPASAASGQPGDQDHGREHDQARSMQSRPAMGGDQRPGRQPDESGQSGQERIEQRTTRPGEAGLANENRPGLGTRGDPTSNQQEKQGRGGSAQQPGKGGTKGGSRSVDPTPKEPRPKPNEQRSDSLEQEQQRSTGMSGQSSGV